MLLLPMSLKTLCTISLLFTMACSVASAQDTDAETVVVDETIDEVTVMGVRSLALLRAEVIEAEEVVYNLFNELNDDDDYDIICKKETRIGSQMPQRICLARMYREAVADATNDDDGVIITVGNMTRSSKHQEILMDKMRALAIEHPELLVALKERYAKEKRFNEERAKRYDE